MSSMRHSNRLGYRQTFSFTVSFFFHTSSFSQPGVWLALGFGSDFPIRRSDDGVSFFSVAALPPLATRMTRANNAYLAGTVLRVLGSGPNRASVYVSSDEGLTFARDIISDEISVAQGGVFDGGRQIEVIVGSDGGVGVTVRRVNNQTSRIPYPTMTVFLDVAFSVVHSR